MYDVMIIGAGVTGAAVAWKLAEYDIKTCVLEKCSDVCEGTSKANSAIIHAGYDAEPGSLKAKLNVRGNEMMDELCEDLDIPFKRIGSLVVCIYKDALPGLKELCERGEKNGVKGLKLLSREEALLAEPNLSDETQGALFAPSAGIICPFELNIAMAEIASMNGAEFKLNTEVQDIKKDNDGLFRIFTNNGEYKARYVVNAAGVYADVIHNMVSSGKMHITQRRGDYCLLDKQAGAYVNHVIFPQPTELGKGVLVAPTVHGNLIVGPTAIETEDKEGTATTAQGISELTQKAGNHVKNIPMNKVITSFAGLRAHEDNNDFIIEEVRDVPGFIDCAGIESPGLTSCPAIGEAVCDILKSRMNFKKKENIITKRKGVRRTEGLSTEEMNALIKENPAYGNVICRCESITEGEILDAIHRPLGARTLDGIKRRTRAGMGRCQAGFCMPRTMEILARELGLLYEDITKSGGDSNIVATRTKGR
ncbi:NAD(P)/FAD-dependent oxidoreductase [Butyrivibrio hungatei]|uniref:NAD(P)/FAD-dependent oxidoreductase n=1 Tax=Butyrivibrio hungatei TaxID=185008 RepID=UPI0003F51189|nr:NAD(P)/FAD-dependent oxidoreductase [Butyrivibrio hungatei]